MMLFGDKQLKPVETTNSCVQRPQRWKRR